MKLKLVSCSVFELETFSHPKYSYTLDVLCTCKIMKQDQLKHPIVIMRAPLLNVEYLLGLVDVRDFLLLWSMAERCSDPIVGSWSSLRQPWPRCPQSSLDYVYSTTLGSLAWSNKCMYVSYIQKFVIKLYENTLYTYMYVYLPWQTCHDEWNGWKNIGHSNCKSCSSVFHSQDVEILVYNWLIN